MTTSQRFVLHGSYPDGVWACAGCDAELHSEEDGTRITHKDGCVFVAGTAAAAREAGAAAERKRIRDMAARNSAVCPGDDGTSCHFADLIPEDKPAAERTTAP